jgi:hypothetical protein
MPFDIAAEEGGPSSRSAFVGDVGEGDVGGGLDQAGRHMVVATRGATGDADTSRLFLCGRDEILQRIIGAVRCRQQHEFRLDEAGDRGDLVDHTVGALNDRRGEYRRRQRQQRVLVAGQAEHVIVGIGVSAARTVLDDDRVLDDPFLVHDLRDGAHDDVRRAASSGTDGEFDRAFRRTHLLREGSGARQLRRRPPWMQSVSTGSLLVSSLINR